MNTTRRYFEEMYETGADPWGFETRWYEQRKYALTMAALPEPRYRSAFEPGCSIGVLSALLARRCQRLLATEIIPGARERARQRLRGLSHVRLEDSSLPDRWPTGPFDLVVLSEIAYYFDADTLETMMSQATSSMTNGGHLVAVHWRGPTDYPLSADGAHEIMAASPPMRGIVHHVEPDFVLDVWEKVT